MPTHDPREPRDPQDPRVLADTARIANLRLEQWYQARRLNLPPEVQAEFTAMAFEAFEAIARDPTRSADAVMDTLIGELDAHLGHIVSTDAGAARAHGGRVRPSWLQRLRRPFGSADRTRPH